MGDSITTYISSEIQLSKYTDEQKQKIISIKDSIDISDEKAVMQLGAQASKNIAELNKTVLSSVKTRDIPELEELLPQLQGAFNEVDSGTLLTKKQSWLSKITRGNNVQRFIEKFESAETVISNIQKNLERVEQELRKDIELENILGQRNIQYIMELEECIVAMRMKLQEEVASLEEKRANVDNNDFVALQILAEEQDKIDGLDKQIFWLEQQRMLAIQTLPLLRNLKNNNKDMVRQVSLTVKQSIPAWEQGIIIAFHIHRQQGALRIERAVHDMTNQIVVQNSRLLKENSVEIAEAVQKGMIDMDTFREANKNLIETTEKLTEIKNLAVQARQNDILEYRKITEQLLEAEKRDVKKLAASTVAGELHA